MKNKNIFSGNLTSIIIGVIVCAFWGSNYPCIKLSYNAFAIDTSSIASIMLIAGIRFLICGIALLCISGFKEKHLRLPDKTNILPILVLSFTTIILHYTVMYFGLSLCEGSKSSILKQIGFLFISCFAFLVVKDDKFSLGKLIGGLLGFAGIVVVNLDGLDLVFGLGEIMILAASLCSVTGNVVGKYTFRRHDPIFCTAYSQFIGGGVLTAIGLLCKGRMGNIDLGGISLMGYMCFASVVAYALWNNLVKYNDISKMAIIKYLEPLFGVIISGLLLGENILKPSYLIAFLLIVTAIIVGNYKKKSTIS